MTWGILMRGQLGVSVLSTGPDGLQGGIHRKIAHQNGDNQAQCVIEVAKGTQDLPGDWGLGVLDQ